MDWTVRQGAPYCAEKKTRRLAGFLLYIRLSARCVCKPEYRQAKPASHQTVPSPAADAGASCEGRGFNFTYTRALDVYVSRCLEATMRDVFYRLG